MKKINLSEKILQREMVERIFFLMLGTFLLGVNYNLFLAPNNLVVGGLSGLALIFEQLWHWNIQIFIYVGTFLMILLSFIFLGKDKTKGTIIGGILYPLMISLTLPLTEILKNYIIIDNELLIISLRTYYNKYVLEYNNLIKKIPYNIIAKFKKYQLRTLLEGKELTTNFNNSLEV